MDTIFKRLQQQLAAERPFALYAKPGENVVRAIFQNTNTVHTLDDLDGEGFVFAPFSEGETAFIPVKEADIIHSPADTDRMVSLHDSELNISGAAKADFVNLVTICVSEIKAGRFNKLVGSRTEMVETGKDVTEIYEALLYTYPNAFRYCFYSPVSGLWMGATPEQLLKAENNTIHTVALAGTQLYSHDTVAVWENKEKQEQQFVTDYILNQLEPYTGSIAVTEPYTFRAGGIVHIKTDISATLREGNSLGDIINTLHPTPAVCGLPKGSARKFLVSHEGYNRQYYSGYLGELNMDNKTDLFVNLRCMKMGEDYAQLFIGCGITKDSDPEKEFFETVNKSLTIRKVL